MNFIGQRRIYTNVFLLLTIALACCHLVRPQDHYDQDLLSLSNSERAQRPEPPGANSEPHAKAFRYPVGWFAPFYSGSGYSSEALNFILSMIRSGAVRAKDTWIAHHGDTDRKEVRAGMEEYDRRQLTELELQVNKSNPAIIVCHSLPTNWMLPSPMGWAGAQCPPDPREYAYVYTIGRTMFETHRLPASFVPRCNSMNEIWVPSDFSREVFIASGVHASKLRVVPEGVNTTQMDPALYAPIPMPQGELVFGLPSPPSTPQHPENIYDEGNGYEDTASSDSTDSSAGWPEPDTLSGSVGGSAINVPRQEHGDDGGGKAKAASQSEEMQGEILGDEAKAAIQPGRQLQSAGSSRVVHSPRTPSEIGSGTGVAEGASRPSKVVTRPSKVVKRPSKVKPVSQGAPLDVLRQTAASPQRELQLSTPGQGTPALAGTGDVAGLQQATTGKAGKGDGGDLAPLESVVAGRVKEGVGRRQEGTGQRASAKTRSQKEAGSEQPFRFLSSFKWEARKGWDVLLEAYLAEFTAEENVELTIITKPFVGGTDYKRQMHVWAERSARKRHEREQAAREQQQSFPQQQAMSQAQRAQQSDWDALLAEIATEARARQSSPSRKTTAHAGDIVPASAAIAHHQAPSSMAPPFAFNVSKLPRLYVVSDRIADADLPRFYKAVDAFVLPSRGEGWGRPHVEAMAMGLPVISTNWSGITAYLDETVGYPIQIDGLVPADPAVWWFRGLNWAQPSVSHLRFLMRQVFTHRTEAKRRGAAARKRMIEEYGPEAIGRLMAAEFMRVNELIPH